MPDSNQMKIGATYMTMNNDFYQTLNAERKPPTRESVYVRDSELDEKAERKIAYYQSSGCHHIINSSKEMSTSGSE